jgi:SpoVK/Ycf46/Vps4 family AAA+-type ATPase
MPPSNNLLPQIEKISSSASKCMLDFRKLIDIKEEIDSISSFLQITHDQTVLFSCMLVLSLQRTVTLDHLARHLKCSAIKIINMIDEIEELTRKSYLLKCNNSGGRKFTYTDFGYVVPFIVVEALRTSAKSRLDMSVRFNLPGFLEKVNELIYSRSDNSMTTKALLDQVEFMISNNKDNAFLKFTEKYVTLPINKCIVYELAYLRFKREYNYCIENITQAIFDDLAEQMEYEQNLAIRRNELFRNDLIRFQESQFMNEKIISLTEKILKILYKDYPELNIKNETEDTFFKSCKIKEKDLYFEKGLQAKISNLTTLLDRKQFARFQKKLALKKLPKGITAIFYGKSGTGKTESVYQIARKTRRDILMVDLSQLRSKWFGESEKIVKRIFDDYRRLSGNSPVKPILFINEADGLFSRRTELKGSGSSVDQTLNTIQNILLQELEIFDGILFATTNLTVNLDSAFERRFLFKVEFNKPMPESGRRIWRSRLPELTETQSDYLATKYDLSGGEIENIVRKYIIDNLAECDSLDFDRLTELCELEKPFQNQNKIGFRKN